MAVRCYIVPADDQYGHAGQSWCTDDAGNYWQRRDSDPPVSNTAPPTTPAGPGNTPPGTVTPTPPTGVPAPGATPGGVGSAEANYALAVWTAAQKAKNDADRLNQLEIPAEQKKEAIDQADQLLRAAAEARNALNDEQRRKLDAATTAATAAKTSGYLPQTGPRVGDLVAQGWNQALANGNANPETAAAIWKTAVGADPQQAASMASWGHQYAATFGHPPSNDEIDQKLQSLGLNPQTPTFEREKYGTDTAMEYLKTRATMSGRPEDAFTYASTIANTPDSIRNIINTAAARTGIAGLAYPGQRTVAGDQSQVQMSTPDTRGLASTDGTAGPGSPQPVLRTAQSLGQASDLDPNTGMPRANQIAAQEYQRANPYLQKMTWAAYGAGNAADPEAEKAKYLASLPQYGGASRGAIRG